ncbi:hypothetical protein Vadar_007914 [Vaccinium darrowii]|uniref:Uncharacterized protein n=1 Tax=Vaccinium darrowii TaxID=229202 RepID=A0ACB7XXK6_9ERIC|nr:hypothetical protein Vadar_007914 [Vaccinium darrowii]
MAATLVGGAFLNSALNVLFDRLASEEFINFFRGRKHDERLLNDLKLKLIEVNKLLNDAENKEITAPAVKHWLDELKDAVYHADDLVDEIAYKALRCKVEAEYQSGSKQVRGWQDAWYFRKGFSSLEELARELVTLKNLKKLEVAECPRLLSFPEGMMSLNNFKILGIENCPNLVLPLSVEMSHCYTSLGRLFLVGCQSLKSLPLGSFPKLRFLFIKNCKNFETLLIPNGIELQNLDDLRIIDCVNMVSFPCRELPAPNLSNFVVMDCDKLKALPKRMDTLLPSLFSLHLYNCPEIESFPEGGLPSKLSDLTISNCKKLVGRWRDWGLQTLPSLTYFTLKGESEDMMESFPEEGLLPSTLTSLKIECLPNLKSLNKGGLQLLGSLQRILIENCHQLQSLPEEALPTSLIILRITNCPLLKSRYRREEGEEWRKIAHVPAIYMDGEEKDVPRSLAFDNFQSQAGHAYVADPSSLAHLRPFNIITSLYQMNFSTPLVTPKTTVKPFIPATPPMSTNLEQYQQPTLGSQLFAREPATPIFKQDLLVVGHLALFHLKSSSRRDVSGSELRSFNPLLLWIALKHWEVRMQIQLKSRKLRIIEGKYIGALFAKLNTVDISRNAALLVQLSQSLDNGDFNTDLQIQVQL